MRKVILFFLSPALLSFLSFADSHYVAQGGANSGGGTADSPWATPQYAAQNAAAGDTIYVKAGSYSGFTFSQNGSSGARYTMIGLNNPAITAMTISGSHITFQGFALSGASVSLEGSYITVRNCDLNNTNITIAAANQGSIIKCKIHAYSNAAIMPNGVCSQILIDSCEIYDLDDTGFYLGLGDNSHHFTFSNNYIHDVGGYGLNLMPSSNGHCNNITFLHNHFRNNGIGPALGGGSYRLAGLLIQRLDTVVLDGNYFDANMGWGVDAYTCRVLTIINNIFANNYDHMTPPTTGAAIGLEVNACPQSKVYNNLFYKNGLANPKSGAAFALNYLNSGHWWPPGPVFVDFRNNIGWKDVMSYYSAVDGDMTGQLTYSCTNNLNLNTIYGTETTDPLLVNPDNGDFHLLSNSPATGKGVPLPEVIYDRDGVRRPNPPSMGPYEYKSAVSTVPEQDNALTGKIAVHICGSNRGALFSSEAGACRIALYSLDGRQFFAADIPAKGSVEMARQAPAGNFLLKLFSKTAGTTSQIVNMRISNKY